MDLGPKIQADALEKLRHWHLRLMAQTPGSTLAFRLSVQVPGVTSLKQLTSLRTGRKMKWQFSSNPGGSGQSTGPQGKAWDISVLGYVRSLCASES